MVTTEGQQVVRTGGDARVKIEPGKRSPRSLAGALHGRECQHHGGLLEFLGHAVGHDPDHAGVPVGAGQDQGCSVLPLGILGDLLLGLLEDPGFQTAAILVELVEVGGQLPCLVFVGGGQQFDGQPGLLQPAGGIDAWSNRKRDVLGLQGRLFFGHIQQCLQPDTRSSREPGQSKSDQHTILSQ